jgi:hypothetical protein
VIFQAFIQEQSHGKLRTEERLVVEELTRRKVPITFYTEKRIRRRQLPLDRQSLVVGDMPCILGVLKQQPELHRSHLGKMDRTAANASLRISQEKSQCM